MAEVISHSLWPSCLGAFVVNKAGCSLDGGWCKCVLQTKLSNTMSTQRPRIAMFPGQFDPITNGHLDVIRRSVSIFDELVIGVGINPDKREWFPIDERLAMMSELVRDLPGARVAKYEGLTVDFARSIGACAILRGIRDVTDLHYEFQLALANRAVGGIETVFIMTGDQHALTSSSLIHQAVGLGADLNKLEPLVPRLVLDRLKLMKQRGLLRCAAKPDAPAT